MIGVIKHVSRVDIRTSKHQIQDNNNTMLSVLDLMITEEMASVTMLKGTKFK